MELSHLFLFLSEYEGARKHKIRLKVEIIHLDVFNLFNVFNTDIKTIQNILGLEIDFIICAGVTLPSPQHTQMKYAVGNRLNGCCSEYQ